MFASLMYDFIYMYLVRVTELSPVVKLLTRINDIFFFY